METKLCVASTLKQYLAKTKEFRNNEKSFFISFRRPYKPVGSQTLGRWIKEVFIKCGIDTDIFKAYSVRHASTSAANRKGLDISVIKKTAGWTANSGTFAKFYNLPLIENRDAFAKTILD